MAGPSNVSLIDLTATAAPTQPNFYTVIGTPGSGITWNRQNIQRGLRYSDSLFQAVTEELTRRLKADGVWGANLRGKDAVLTAIIDNTISVLQLPDNVGLSSPNFLKTAVRTLIRLLNEAPAKQQSRVKRESQDSQESSPSKARKTSESGEKIFSSPYFPPASSPPDPNSIQLMIGDNTNEVRLISVQKVMKDPAVTTYLWQQVELSKLINILRIKGFWHDEDERPAEQSRLSYQFDQASLPIYDNDDLQEACKHMERLSMTMWKLYIDRAARDTTESSSTPADSLLSRRRLASRPRRESRNPPSPPPTGTPALAKPPNPSRSSSPPQQTGTAALAELPDPSYPTPSLPPSALSTVPAKENGPPPAQSAPHHAQREKSLGAISISSDDTSVEDYGSEDASPPYRPGDAQYQSTSALPVELAISDAHKDRTSSSYDIELGEITHERRAQDDMKGNSKGDLHADRTKLGAEERPQWSEEVWTAMEQILQFDGDAEKDENRRSFRGLGKIVNKEGITVDIKPFIHQTYDLIWRRIMVDRYGGAINADEPGFGKTLMVLMSWVFERQLALRREALDGYNEIRSLNEFNRSRFAHKHLPPRRLRQHGLDHHEKCPSADYLDVACHCEGRDNYVAKFENKAGIVLCVVPAKILPNWLAEISKLVDFSDRKVMQLRCFYAHAGIRYKNVNAEPITNANKRLLECNKDGSAKPGQERFLVVTSPQSYENHVKGVLTGDYAHNFTVGQLYVDEFHETKKDDAPVPKLVDAIKTELEEAVQEANPQQEHESAKDWHQRLKPRYQAELPYVCGFSATPWIKSFNDMAAMIGMIEQPWWVYDGKMKHMTGQTCRRIGKATENMEARITDAPDAERKSNIEDMKTVLDCLMIKRTAKSTFMNSASVLVALPPHETRRIECPLSDEQRKILHDADQFIMDQAKAEYEERCKDAIKHRKPPPAPSAFGYFSKAHKLRAATVVPNILAFAKEHHLKLTDDEMRNDKNCQRPTYPELEGKDSNWLRTPEDSLYQLNLRALTQDAPKLSMLKTIIDGLGEDIYGRPEKLVIFTSSPVISMIVALWLKELYPPEQTLWCSSAVPLKDREARYVRPFEDDDTSRFLVSTKRILGTGVTLTRAFRSVNLDADWEEHWDIQCDGRVIRLSQKNKKTYNYYLILDDVASLDHKILDKKVRREMVRSWAYSQDDEGEASTSSVAAEWTA